jgi:hypothetical protein
MCDIHKAFQQMFCPQDCWHSYCPMHNVFRIVYTLMRGRLYGVYRCYALLSTLISPPHLVFQFKKIQFFNFFPAAMPCFSHPHIDFSSWFFSPDSAIQWSLIFLSIGSHFAFKWSWSCCPLVSILISNGPDLAVQWSWFACPMVPILLSAGPDLPSNGPYFAFWWSWFCFPTVVMLLSDGPGFAF